MRVSEITRNTRETKIVLKLNLDGNGRADIDSGVGFLNHMLELLTVHSGFDLTVQCKGDTDVDFHHSVEDIGIALGLAFKESLGDKKGIRRFADKVVPMDETAAQVALDISGRPYLIFDCAAELSYGKIGEFDCELVEEFLRAFCNNAGVNVFVRLLATGNKHHEAEAIFKALAKCLGEGVQVVSDKIPSSKGVL